MRVELHNPDVLGGLRRANYAPLDLLGFDMAYFSPIWEKGIDLVYPSLARKRLYAAMCYNKSEVGLNLSISTDLIQSYVVTLAKCQSLYLMGGFLDSTASPILRATYALALGKLG